MEAKLLLVLGPPSEIDPLYEEIKEIFDEYQSARNAGEGHKDGDWESYEKGIAEFLFKRIGKEPSTIEDIFGKILGSPIKITDYSFNMGPFRGLWVAHIQIYRSNVHIEQGSNIIWPPPYKEFNKEVVNVLNYLLKRKWIGSIPIELEIIQEMNLKEDIKSVGGKDLPISGGIGNSPENPIEQHRIQEMNLKEEIKSACGKDFPISGGIGNSRENPIIIHKVIPPIEWWGDLPYEILHCLGVMRNIQWKVLEDNFIVYNHRTLDKYEIEVKFTNKEEIITTIENYYFDITEYLDISTNKINDLRFFQVDEDGYIIDESYDALTPFKHKDAYAIPRQIENLDDLIECMEYQPFAWVIDGEYYDFVEEQIPEDEKDKWTQRFDDGQNPEDRKAIEQWQSYLGEKEFIQQMNSTLQEWLNEDVDISEEELYSDIPLYSDAMVFLFFNLEPEMVEKLNIGLIDGPYPGSDYQGAKLGISIEEANKICVVNQFPIRFEKFKNKRVE